MMIDERDKRQLIKMQSQIVAFRNGDLSLKSLIGDLLFLRDTLSSCDEKWERNFTNHIADLDSAYAYALEKNGGKLEPTSQKVVDEAVPKILTMIDKFVTV